MKCFVCEETSFSSLHFALTFDCYSLIGLQAAKELSASGYESVHFEVQDKYYALAACAALLKYIEHTYNMVFAMRSLRMSFRGSSQTTFIGLLSWEKGNLILKRDKRKRLTSYRLPIGSFLVSIG